MEQATLGSVAWKLSLRELPHVFERFYRAKTGKTAEGLGLGLYISRLIVEAHGGDVCVESEPGKGSTQPRVPAEVLTGRHGRVDNTHRGYYRKTDPAHPWVAYSTSDPTT